LTSTRLTLYLNLEDGELENTAKEENAPTIGARGSHLSPRTFHFSHPMFNPNCFNTLSPPAIGDGGSPPRIQPYCQ
jgi:hypothetical protein